MLFPTLVTYLMKTLFDFEFFKKSDSLVVHIRKFRFLTQISSLLESNKTSHKEDAGKTGFKRPNGPKKDRKIKAERRSWNWLEQRVFILAGSRQLPFFFFGVQGLFFFCALWYKFPVRFSTRLRSRPLLWSSIFWPFSADLNAKILIVSYTGKFLDTLFFHL